ncbi:MAG: hypothetical protein WAK31_19930 [Chthoniobacterales bacterium]
MKIGIVGCGMVGSSVAFALVMRGVGREVVLSRIPLRLDPCEQKDLERSASIVHDAIESLRL